MSSTDDSAINARSRMNPSRVPKISPKRHAKRIGYGATIGSRKQSHLTPPPTSNPKNYSFKDDDGGDGRRRGDGNDDESDIKTDAFWKLTSASSTCEAAGGSCCCGFPCCGCGENRRRPARRGCVVFIVFLALLLDSLLLTCMVPIIPNYLRESATKEDRPSPATPSITPATIIEPGLSVHKWGLDDSFQMSPVLPHNSVKSMSNNADVQQPLFKKPTTSPSMANMTYTKENTKISLLFASKTLVQVLTNLIVGPLTERIGYSVPMFSGFVVLLLS
ncbi:hypothetical protein EGW08_015850, partial [Elysia chlorotica]